MEREPNPLHVPGLTIEELTDAVVALGEPVFRAKQILDWLYRKLVCDFTEMRNLPKTFLAEAATKLEICRASVEDVFVSQDDTRKLLLRLHDGARIETVIIPENERLTCCISSQVGCGMGCVLCASGMFGLERNLTAGEIVEQVLHAAKQAGRQPTHIVVMGIGEPLANYDAVLRAIKILNADWAFNIAARRITVSTVGIPDAIERLAGEQLQVNLAISLHAPNDMTRNQIVPANRRFGIDKILHAGRHYFTKTGREITIEYALVAGMNDGIAAAEELARRLKGYPCTVNLIACNPVPELGVKPPPYAGVKQFLDVLHKRGIRATIRKPRGVEVGAGCGQLRAERVNRKR